MICLDSVEFKELLEESNRLRDAGKRAEAVTLMAARFNDMGPECYDAAYAHAEGLARTEPRDPFIEGILAKAHRHKHGEHQGGLSELAKPASTV